jgi:hypothetical protein
MSDPMPFEPKNCWSIAAAAAGATSTSSDTAISEESRREMASVLPAGVQAMTWR